VPGRALRLAGRCYRVTRTAGDQVWGRPLPHDARCDDVVLVESPIKGLRRRIEATDGATP
jgi:hypothetical protein